MTSIENCNNCGISFIATGDERVCDTWVCLNCLDSLISEGVIPLPTDEAVAVIHS